MAMLYSLLLQINKSYKYTVKSQTIGYPVNYAGINGNMTIHTKIAKSILIFVDNLTSFSYHSDFNY